MPDQHIFPFLFRNKLLVKCKIALQLKNGTQNLSRKVTNSNVVNDNRGISNELQENDQHSESASGKLFTKRNMTSLVDAQPAFFFLVSVHSRQVTAMNACSACCTAAADLTSSLKRCSRCKMVCYCSITCQQSHWSIHKHACRQHCAAAICVPFPVYIPTSHPFGINHTEEDETSSTSLSSKASFSLQKDSSDQQLLSDLSSQTGASKVSSSDKNRGGICESRCSLTPKALREIIISETERALSWQLQIMGPNNIDLRSKRPNIRVRIFGALVSLEKANLHPHTHSTNLGKEPPSILPYEIIIEFATMDSYDSIQALLSSSIVENLTQFQAIEEAINRTPAISIDDCLLQFMRQEQLQQTEGWFCSSCKSARPATKKLSLHRAPPILILQLKRFKGGGHSIFYNTKLDHSISTPLKLDLTPYFSRSSPHNTKSSYDLFAVVHHYGLLHTGHYIADVQHPSSKKWFRFDDEQVIPLATPEDAIEKGSSISLLFYTLSPPAPSPSLPLAESST